MSGVNFDRLIVPPPTVTQVSYWATVTQTSPLRIQLDGDPGPLPFTPDTLVAGLEENDRVYVQLQTNSDPNFVARRATVIGKSGGVSIPEPEPPINPFPVGSIYISVDSTNPGTLFGGTWERIQDRFLLAAGTTYAAGTTGGSATHTLTPEELPNHVHGWAATATAGASGTGDQPVRGSGTTDGNFRMQGELYASETYGSSQLNNGQPHNNMPPYLAVYVWKRTA